MQIIYAAPFLLVSAICFFVCAAFGQTRKQALVLPVAILSFGVGSLICYAIFALIAYKLGRLGPANWFYLIAYIFGGLFVAIVCSAFYKMIVAALPPWLISAGLIIATFASTLVFLPFVSFAITHFVSFENAYVEELVALGVMWIVIASFVSWRIVKISEQFRPDPCLPRIMTRIFPHLDTPQRNEPTT